jgi:hypothetical protein
MTNEGGMSMLKKSLISAVTLGLCIGYINASDQEHSTHNLPKDPGALAQHLKTSPHTASQKAWVLINTYIEKIYGGISNDQLGSLFKKVTGIQDYGKGNTNALRLQMKTLKNKFKNMDAGGSFLSSELKHEIEHSAAQITEGWSTEHKKEFEKINILDNIQEFLGHKIYQNEDAKNGYNIAEPVFKLQ